MATNASTIYSVRQQGRNDDPKLPTEWAEVGRPRGFVTFLAAISIYAAGAELRCTVPIKDVHGETITTGAIYDTPDGRAFSIFRA